MAGRSQRPDRLREALAQLAAAEAPELLAEARLAARTRARALIEDALVEELLHAAANVRGARSAAPPQPQSPPEPGLTATAATAAEQHGEAFWTYCILAAGDRDAAPTGAGGVEPSGSVEVVEEGALAAVVSAVPLAEFSDERLREHLNDVEWVERVARAHEGILEGVLERATILPLRLCTLYRDKEGVARMLREQEPSLRQALATLEGRREWGVKLFVDPDRLAAASAGDEADPDPGGEPTGTAYLARRRQERVARERAAELGDSVAQEVHARLERVADDSRANPLQRPEVHGRDAHMLLNGAYLVPRERERELEQAVESLREQWQASGFELELTGPWPSYNFVSTTATVMP